MKDTTLASSHRAHESIGAFVALEDYAALKAVGRTLKQNSAVIVGFLRRFPRRYATKGRRRLAALNLHAQVFGRDAEPYLLQALREDSLQGVRGAAAQWLGRIARHSDEDVRVRLYGVLVERYDTEARMINVRAALSETCSCDTPALEEHYPGRALTAAAVRVAVFAPVGERRRRELLTHAVGTLTAWLASHLENPHPTPEEQQSLMAQTGIDAKQLKSWFANARRRIWRPMVAARRRRQRQREENERESEAALGGLASFLDDDAAEPVAVPPFPSPTAPAPGGGLAIGTVQVALVQLWTEREPDAVLTWEEELRQLEERVEMLQREEDARREREAARRRAEALRREVAEALAKRERLAERERILAAM